VGVLNGLERETMQEGGQVMRRGNTIFVQYHSFPRTTFDLTN
jgi:hypothetical protein